jgi:hypothetical protein
MPETRSIEEARIQSIVRFSVTSGRNCYGPRNNHPSDDISPGYLYRLLHFLDIAESYNRQGPEPVPIKPETADPDQRPIYNY